MSTYAGTPLDASKKEIRLLHVQPASDLNDEVSGDLTTASIPNSSTKFEALSYTWGDASEKHAITLNGKDGHAVTDNLYYALRRLRRRRVERIVWIDAICINQDDIDEKASQLTLMGEIYSNASRVLIWIGESEKAERAEPGVRGSVTVKYLKLYRQPNPILFSRQTHHFIEAIRRTAPHWWERAWVVQEAACAKDITVMFGPCEMKWYWFYMLLYGIWEDCTYEDEATKDKINKADDAVSQLRDIRNRHQKKQAQSIVSLMWDARHSQASVAHDKVYSLLAMMPPGIAQFLRPDYKEPISEVFAKATCAAIADNGNLDLLGWIPFRNAPGTQQQGELKVSRDDVGAQLEIWRNPELPSWVVDFTNIKYSLFDTPVQTMLQNVWDKARTYATNVRYLGNGRVGLDGFFLDEIKSVAQLRTKLRSPSPEDEDLLCDLLAQASASFAEHDPTCLFQFQGKESKSAKDKKRVKGPFTSTEWYKHELEDKKRKESHLDYLAHGLLLWEESVGFPRTFPSGYDNSFSGVLGKHHWYEHLETYSTAMASNAIVFITKMGLIGVAPAGIRQGDVVTLLDGARLPIILSPRGGDKEELFFRGYSYVHGSMRRDYQYWQLRKLQDGEKRKRRNRFIIC